MLRTEHLPSRFGDLRCTVVPSTLGFRHSAGFKYFNRLFLAIITHNNDALKVVLARGDTPYLPLLPLLPPHISVPFKKGARFSRKLHTEHHEAMRDIQLSPLALALYAFNVQAVRLLCLVHEPQKKNFFELLDFATIDCFFECFAASNRRRTSDSFDSLDVSNIPGFWADSSDGSKCPDSSDHSESSEYSRECTYLGMYRDTFSALLKYGPPIEQNILVHELVKALKVRNLSAASILIHHGAKLSAEAENIRADLVLANYCLYDWRGCVEMHRAPRVLPGTSTGYLGNGLS